MSEKSMFFNNDQCYSASDFARYFDTFFTSGVHGNRDPLALKVSSGGGMTACVSPGTANICGYRYELTDTLNFPVAPAEALPRLDRVILRLDLTLESPEIRAKVLQGTASANPLPPSLTRTNDVFDLSLAIISVGSWVGVITDDNITDQRGDYSVCGYSSGVGQPAYQPPGDISSLMYEYSMFPKTLSAEQIGFVESNHSLMSQFRSSRLFTFSDMSCCVCPYTRRQEILSSGTWTCPENVTVIDAVLAGGGGGGGIGGGGGGGRFLFKRRISVVPGTAYLIVIGAGGAVNTQGGTTTAFGFGAPGGNPPSGGCAGKGGSGGGGTNIDGGHGGHDGSPGCTGSIGMSGPRYTGGPGLDPFTIDPYTLIPYCGGGGGHGNGGSGYGYGGTGGGGNGANLTTAATAGTANTGGGGGGGATSGTAQLAAPGGSGILIIYY